ncbi:MAG TPA: hypothetical protein VF432_20810 [Thermoanaerobaculia bacterium]
MQCCVRKLGTALHQVSVATRQYAAAERYLSEAAEAFERALPELRSGDAPELLELAAERCAAVHHYLSVAVNEVVLGHTEIFDRVEAGELVPEDPRHAPRAGQGARQRDAGAGPEAGREAGGEGRREAGGAGEAAGAGAGRTGPVTHGIR